MSRIDVAELTEFLHNLKKSNDEARTMLKNIQAAAEEYATDTSLKGKAVTASQTYFRETYPVLCKTLIEALNESEDRLEQYIREFGEQVDPSPNSKVDAQLLQEFMNKVAVIKRKQEDLLLRMSAGTGTLYEGQQQSLRTQFTDAIEQENILERYIAFEQSHANFFDSLSELVYQAKKAIQELTDHVTFNSQTGTYELEKLDTTRFEALQELLPKKKKYNFNEYEIRYNGATHILLKNGIVDVEATNAYNEAIKNGELEKVSNQATESAEAIKAVVAALKKGRDPITGQKISKAQSFGILAGLVYMYAGGRYKGRKIKIPKSALANLEKGKTFKGKKINSGGSSLKYKDAYFEGSSKVGGVQKDISRKIHQLENIDLNRIDEATGLTNLELMKKGKSPIWEDGSKIELHHMLQIEPGPMAELPASLHDKYYSVLHGLTENGNSFRNNAELAKQYNNFRSQYWKWRATQIK